MNRILAVFIGIILATGILGFLIFRAVRQAPTGVSDVVPVRSDVLTSDVADKIKLREVNGQIPVQVLPENFGRDDPFANF